MTRSTRSLISIAAILGVPRRARAGGRGGLNPCGELSGARQPGAYTLTADLAAVDAT
jgi:hypothetical protein